MSSVMKQRSEQLRVVFARNGDVLVVTPLASEKEKWAKVFNSSPVSQRNAVRCVAAILNEHEETFAVYTTSNQYYFGVFAEFGNEQPRRVFNAAQLRYAARGGDHINGYGGDFMGGTIESFDDSLLSPFMLALKEQLATLAPPFVPFPGYLRADEIKRTIEALEHEVSRLINRAFINLPNVRCVNPATDTEFEAILRQAQRLTTSALETIDAHRATIARLKTALVSE